eukprot:Nitzschia sp. Nitz4//scaffold19_size178191//176186//177304//NITZ4_002020-RA/size178191-processed-gene-0.96-mRNA-1//-1//CDS//3329540810//5656//frame0
MASNEILFTFLESASLALESINPELECRAMDGNWLLSDCRRCVLGVQTKVLQQTVQRVGGGVTVQQVQTRLSQLHQDPSGASFAQPLQRFETAARLAVGRLALYAELTWNETVPPPRDLQKEGTFSNALLLEYISLCETALKMPETTAFLKDGTLPFGKNVSSDIPGTATPARITPVERWQYIQRYLARAVGWDPEWATRQFQSMMLQSNNLSVNAEVLSRLSSLQQQAHETLSKAFEAQLDDTQAGGCTRVIAVQYQEWEADAPTTGSMGVSSDRMHREHLAQEKEQLRQASQALQLQQNMQNELKQMDPALRAQTVAQAAEASERFLRETMALPPGAERIAYLQALDPATSRLLAIHKIWTAMQASENAL